MAKKKKVAKKTVKNAGATPAKKRRVRPSRAKGAGLGSGGIRSVSTQALHDELSRRSSTLFVRRDELMAELGMIDAEIASLGIESASQPTRRAAGRAVSKHVASGSGRASTKKRRGGGRRKGKGGSTLEDSLVAMLTGKIMGVTEVSEAVKKAGYKTDSPNFRTIVNQCMTKSDRIRKVSRGQYTAV